MHYNRHKFAFVGNVNHAFKLDFGGCDRFLGSSDVAASEEMSALLSWMERLVGRVASCRK